ncbi:2TM domain-containing protein [Paenibacillus antri]|uniref:2TM domain-containing protein n=1 Tax=Paenibacillus antri TaxID=2582848 RepID=A0A5R9G6B9_9BACL|nr:2TM domain-containing protein [Paenibacillus antri]TLS50599.1 2TM domain-containing protein [Paenibacillus antri]
MHSYGERRSSRARMENEFYKHALVFGMVNTGLAVYNVVTTPGDIWFVYPLFGWGIGLVSHGAKVIFAPKDVR